MFNGIVIIAILAAMLLPALNKARAKAKQIKCASNTKSLVLMSMSYSDDYNGFLMGAGNDSDLSFWPIKMEPYSNIKWDIGIKKFLNKLGCPEEPIDPAQENSWIAPNAFLDTDFWNISGKGGGAFDLCTLKVSTPSKHVYFADSIWSYYKWNSCTYRHQSKRSNFGFMDGHVENTVTRGKFTMKGFPPLEYKYDPRDPDRFGVKWFDYSGCY